MQLSNTKPLDAGAVLPVQIAPDLQFDGTATHPMSFLGTAIPWDVNHGVEYSEPYLRLNTESYAITLREFVAKQVELTKPVFTNSVHLQTLSRPRVESEHLNILRAGNNSGLQEQSIVEESIALPTWTSETDPLLSGSGNIDFGNLLPEAYEVLSPLVDIIEWPGDTSLEEPANVVPNKKKRYRGRNWEPKQITSFFKSRLEVVNSKPKLIGKDHWKSVSEELKKQSGIITRWKQCEDLWGTLLKRFESIEKDLQSMNIHSSDESAWVQYWESGGDPKSTNKLIRVFSLECFIMMDEILRKKPRVRRKSTTAGSKRQQMVSGLDAGPSSSLPSDSTITSVDVPGRFQGAKSPSTAPLTEGFDNSKEQGHGEQQTEDERPVAPNLSSETSALIQLLSRPNSTTEQNDLILKIRKKELELAILREKNKAHEHCQDKGPRKHRKKKA